MLFHTIEYFLFLPAIIIIYFILPHRFRWAFLLICSYFFYMCWNAKYALLLATSTIVTFLSGMLISRTNSRFKVGKTDKNSCLRSKKLFVTLSFSINLLILGFFKYSPMILKTAESLSLFFGKNFSVPTFKYLLPVGISFYTFQALSYTMDIYRGNIDATKHLGKYALFVSFFPQLVAGPIERSTHLLPQFDRKNVFNPARTREGILLILWGMFKKLVVADFFSLAVNFTYGNMNAVNPISYAYVTVLFAFQIYCDFSSYSDIAIGSAKILGYDLMKNFNRPYFAVSIKEFWRKWHISLSTWFKDYLYIPLGGSRVSNLKKYRNIMIVFVCSGLWHGANWTFVIWGFLHGIYHVFGSVTHGIRTKFLSKTNLSRESMPIKILSIIFTFALVCFGWIFFRAGNITYAFTIIKSLFSFNKYIFDFVSIMHDTGYTLYNIGFSFFGIFILLAVEILQSKISFIAVLEKSPVFVRGLVYLILILVIILLGEYGMLDSTFIYFQF